MLPPKDNALYLNFDPQFKTALVLPKLVLLQHSLEMTPDRDIVINLEQCNWFGLFPLAQLLTVLSSGSKSFTGMLHVIAPFKFELPFLSSWVAKQSIRMSKADISPDERKKYESQVLRHKKELPRRRMMAGAFLVGWGAFDVIEEFFISRVRWYYNREQDVSRSDLNYHYEFAYGADPATNALISDRVWPFTTVHRGTQADVLRRLNGEDLVAGPLHNYAGIDLISNGIATNVIMFEPFDNVFEHAFDPPSAYDMAMIALQVKESTNASKMDLTVENRSKVESSWESKFRRALEGKAVLEVTVTDCGAGIPSTLAKALSNDKGYLHGRPKKINELVTRGGWEAIKYAFEPHSTRRASVPAGKRGLAWLKDVIGEAQGAVEVYSNGSTYVLADLGHGLHEVQYDEINASDGSVNLNHVRGTFVRILIPVSRTQQSMVRGPRWPVQNLTASLFTRESTPITTIAIPESLIGLPKEELWETFLRTSAKQMLADRTTLIAIDLEENNLTRSSLELFGEAFLRMPELHGRVILLNCNQHITSRISTVMAFAKFESANLILPLLQPGLRLYWVGVSPEEEVALLGMYQQKHRKQPLELIRLVDANPSYFVAGYDGVALRFTAVEIEEVVRRNIGKLLQVSLNQRNALHFGRYRIPSSEQSVSTFVEPHQLLSDSFVARKLCSHLAMLLRYRFERIGKTDRIPFRILTATRIGRDISARMPAAFSLNRFVYFDYHLVQPSKPRLLKHLVQSRVVIVVDIVTTGSQIEQLIEACKTAGATILGIVSFIDFSPGDSLLTKNFYSSHGNQLEHITIWRSPQTLSKYIYGDIIVDHETLSIAATEQLTDEVKSTPVAELVGFQALRYLEDAQALHTGHFALLGHHYDAKVNLGRVVLGSTPAQEHLMRACESAILKPLCPMAIVIYPDLSGAHMLHTALERRHRVSIKVTASLLRFVEARRTVMARTNKYWLSAQEITDLTQWATEKYPDGYGVVILDDGASSGDTLFALQALALQLLPKVVSTFVVTNRMPLLHSIHHAATQRIADVEVNFGSFLHLDIPVYRRADCPLCRERDDLLRERQYAKERWYIEEIDRRTAMLDANTTLHPQDLPEGLYSKESHSIKPFHWEVNTCFPGPKQTIGSRIASIRIAMSSGYSLLRTLNEVLDSGSELLWRVAAPEIARLHNLQQAQSVEAEIAKIFIKALRSRQLTYGIVALDALYLMRPEALQASTTLIVRVSLRHVENENNEPLASLILLLRRLLSYRHFEPSEAFDEEQSVVSEIDRAYGSAPPSSPRREALARLNTELRGLPHQGLGLPTIIFKMERVFQTTRRTAHKLLYQLGEYIGDRPETVSRDLLGAINTAVMATRLATLLAPAGRDCGRLKDENLERIAREAYDQARNLSQRVQSVAHKTEPRDLVDLRDRLDLLKELCSKICEELDGHITNGCETLSAEWKHFLQTLPVELENTRLDIVLPDTSTQDTPINLICDNGLFTQIVRNIFGNLRHAIDKTDKTSHFVNASITFRPNASGAIASLEVKCFTGEPPPGISLNDSTTRRLAKDIETYGGFFELIETDATEPLVRWHEIWQFRRV